MVMFYSLYIIVYTKSTLYSTCLKNYVLQKEDCIIFFNTRKWSKRLSQRELEKAKEKNHYTNNILL